MTASLLLAAFPLVVVFSLLSLVKAALRSLSSVTLRRLADAASPRLRQLIEEFLGNPTEFILHLQSLIQVLLVITAALVTTAFHDFGLRAPLATALLTLGAFVLLLEHLFPRLVTAIDNERLVRRLLPVYEPFEPAARLLSAPPAALYRAFFKGPPGVSEAEGEPSSDTVRAFIDVGEAAGILDESEGEIVESLVDFGETLVREVKTPRVDMVSIAATASISELRDLILETKHSRIPVWRERPDNIEGVVYIKDLLGAWKDGKESEKVGAWMKPTVFVPESKRVSSLLKEFQRSGVTFAIVVDEYGSTSGLVSIEDLIEEIVGEIKDEHDPAPVEVVAQPDGSFLVSGKAEIETLEELFGLNLEDADFETMAGLVFTTLGRVPAPGEEFTHLGLTFQVVDADRHRVNQVRITPIDKKAPTAVIPEGGSKA